MRNVLFILALGFCHWAWSQPLPTDSLPLNNDIRYGILPNGLTYYIQSNSKPENYAVLRLVVKVGSAVELESQQGMAHFIEHMAFKGTSHFKGKELIDFIEKTGGKFGADLHAQTGMNETLYRLNVPTNDSILFNKGLQVLEDWAQSIQFDPLLIANEKLIIEEERRERQNAEERARLNYLPEFMKGSVYADRKPIGKTEIIEGFTHASLLEFYKKWYRPDLMGIVLIGDFEINTIENLVKQKFGAISKPNTPLPSIDFVLPSQDQPQASVSSDKEFVKSNVSLFYKQTNQLKVITWNDFRLKLTHELFIRMQQNRWNKWKQKFPDFEHKVRFSPLVRNHDYFANEIEFYGSDWKPAMELLYLELNRIKLFGFSYEEMEEAKESILSESIRKANQKEATDSRYLSSYCIGHFLRSDQLLGPDLYLWHAQELLHRIDVSEVNSLAEKWMGKDNNLFIILQLKQDDSASVPTNQECLNYFLSIRTDTLQPIQFFPKINSVKPPSVLPEKGKLLNVKSVSSSCSQWQLSNGVQLTILSTKRKPGEVVFKAVAPGGRLSESANDYSILSYLPEYLMGSGLGDYSSDDIDFFIRKRKLSFFPSYDNGRDQIDGKCDYSNLESLFYLNYLYFTAGKIDSIKAISTINSLQSSFNNSLNDPENFFYYTINSLFDSCQFGRFPSTEFSTKKAMELYRKHVSNAANYQFFLLGDIDTVELKPLVEKYLSSLPSSAFKPSLQELKLAWPSRNMRSLEFRKGIGDKVYFSQVYFGGLDKGEDNVLEMRLLQSLLQVRLRNLIRDQNSGAYVTNAFLYLEEFPAPSFRLILEFRCNPEKLESLVTQLDQMVDQLRKQGFSEAEFFNALEANRKQLQQQFTLNEFWMEAMIKAHSNGHDLPTVDDFLQQLNRVNLKRLNSKARKVLKPGKCFKFIMKPE
ncbi:MAG: insulinase family protein [Bacteroidia bacterium]|nr:insulinase family protein [Bacteroidia bacterium]